MIYYLPNFPTGAKQQPITHSLTLFSFGNYANYKLAIYTYSKDNEAMLTNCYFCFYNQDSNLNFNIYFLCADQG